MLYVIRSSLLFTLPHCPEKTEIFDFIFFRGSSRINANQRFANSRDITASLFTSHVSQTQLLKKEFY